MELADGERIKINGVAPVGLRFRLATFVHKIINAKLNDCRPEIQDEHLELACVKSPGFGRRLTWLPLEKRRHKVNKIRSISIAYEEKSSSTLVGVCSIRIGNGTIHDCGNLND